MSIPGMLEPRSIDADETFRPTHATALAASASWNVKGNNSSSAKRRRRSIARKIHRLIYGLTTGVGTK